MQPVPHGNGTSLSLHPLLNLPSLTLLDLSGAKSTLDLASVAACSTLLDLQLRSCIDINDMTPLAACSTLTALNVRKCRSLSSIDFLCNMRGLTWLDVTQCTMMTSIQPLVGLPQLKTLHMSGCTGLLSTHAIPALHMCDALQRLDIHGCMFHPEDLDASVWTTPGHTIDMQPTRHSFDTLGAWPYWPWGERCHLWIE